MMPRRFHSQRQGYTRRKLRLTLNQMIAQQFALLQAATNGADVAAQLAAAALSAVNLPAGPKDGSHA